MGRDLLLGTACKKPGGWRPLAHCWELGSLLRVTLHNPGELDFTLDQVVGSKTVYKEENHQNWQQRSRALSSSVCNIDLCPRHS